MRSPALPSLPPTTMHFMLMSTQIRTFSTTLHALLDYDEEDSHEATFELSLFAEAFQVGAAYAILLARPWKAALQGREKPAVVSAQQGPGCAACGR